MTVNFCKSAMALATSLLLVSCAAPGTNSNPDGSTTATAPASKTEAAAAGATLGCLGGAILAELMGKDAKVGCAAGALLGGLAGYEKARQAEIDAAEAAQREAVQAYAALPANQQPKMSAVKTVDVVAEDPKTKEKKSVKAFDSVSLDLPISTKELPEYDQAIGKLKALAEKVADERGSADISIGMTATDAKARKVKLETATVHTKKGNPITVGRYVSEQIPKGTERFTVKAGKLNTKVS
ncbi:hypothetical protein NQT62_13910 [Limnobacter humi]|uniref:Glycine zipper domain-containing protein n=1 Tax=Limnobacter humi TaxID=1778671 RepID=A0ABT1WKP6_9BURK|nr:hypothetical protein [Limnobacter humi]MCQ8897532.1 hypothetical protein [Limnobacter humi]